MQAQKSLSSISLNQDLWMAQYRQEIFERDRISGLTAARREGLDEGMEKGRKVGRDEGFKESARRALAMGLPIAQVSQITGLSVAELEGL